MYVPQQFSYGVSSSRGYAIVHGQCHLRVASPARGGGECRYASVWRRAPRLASRCKARRAQHQNGMRVQSPRVCARNLPRGEYGGRVCAQVGGIQMHSYVWIGARMHGAARVRPSPEL